MKEHPLSLVFLSPLCERQVRLHPHREVRSMGPRRGPLAWVLAAHCEVTAHLSFSQG